MQTLEITSPKRSHKNLKEWGAFFPYYAGYSENFANAILASARLSDDAIVLDPWNGSGTTTHAAVSQGLSGHGIDLNPAMVIIARARLLAPSEADCITPLAHDIAKAALCTRYSIDDSDPLSVWLGKGSASAVRSIELDIRHRLVGQMTLNQSGVRLDHISCLAATFYVALFATCRSLVGKFQSTNPTWLRTPKCTETRAGVPRTVIAKRFVASLSEMAHALAVKQENGHRERASFHITLGDSTAMGLPSESVDFILTSPPYCTRIDYTAATRVELALLAPLLRTSVLDLSRTMIGSTRVPHTRPAVSASWGARCARFLRKIQEHPSRASSGYYYSTHLDYFDKIAKSMDGIALSLKTRGRAIIVVQDSYYKEIHNELPAIITEIADARRLRLSRRVDFTHSNSMLSINTRARKYKKSLMATEAVLCFEKV